MFILYLIVGLMAILGAVVGMMVVIPLIGPGRRGESRETLAYLGEAIGRGRVGEEVAGGEEEYSSPFDRHLPRRQVIEWLPGGGVMATTRHRRLFYGQVVGRLRRGELLVRRERGCPVRVRQPQ